MHISASPPGYMGPKTMETEPTKDRPEGWTSRQSGTQRLSDGWLKYSRESYFVDVYMRSEVASFLSRKLIELSVPRMNHFRRDGYDKCVIKVRVRS